MEKRINMRNTKIIFFVSNKKIPHPKFSEYFQIDIFHVKFGSFSN